MSFLVQKAKPPRKLENETLESFEHWRSQFRTCYKRDPTYSTFFESTSTWDSSQKDWNQTADKVGSGATAVDRSASSKKDDLIDFLNLINSFMSHSYLQQKIVYQSKSLQDVWDFMKRSFNIEISQLSFLKMCNLSKRDSETHLAFYDRIVNCIRLHLAPKNVTVDNVSTPLPSGTDTLGGDKLSVTLLDVAALLWFDKLPHKNLSAIVEVEYSTELRNNERISSLVPKIAENIDSLLARYNSTSVGAVQPTATALATSSTAKVEEIRSTRPPANATEDDTEDDSYNKAIIAAALKKFEKGKKYDKKSSSFKSKSNSFKKPLGSKKMYFKAGV